MPRWLSHRMRFAVKPFPAMILVLLAALSGLAQPLLGVPPQRNSAFGPPIYLQESRSLQVTRVGASPAAQNVASEPERPLALASGDVDEDGIIDLLVGYGTTNGGTIVVHRGSLDAFAPQSAESWQAIGDGRFPSPFRTEARVFAIPIKPDFIAVGNFTGNGHLDLVAASLGGSALYVFAGDGTGKFTDPRIIHLSGLITTLAAGNLGKSLGFTDLIIGLHSLKGIFLSVYAGTESGLSPLTSYPLAAEASAVAFGNLDGDLQPDAAILSGDQVLVLHAASLQLEAVSLPVSVRAFALGSFVHDRDPRLQMALLTSDGNVHIATRIGLDPRPFTRDEIRAIRLAQLKGRQRPRDLPIAPAGTGDWKNEDWKIVETLSAISSFDSALRVPVLLRTRISNHAADDLVLVDASAGQLVVISHPNLPPGATAFVPGEVSARPYSGSPAKALSLRLNVDARPGLVFLHDGQVAPLVMLPIPDPTFFVNTTADPIPGATAATCNNTSSADLSSSCSLREAVIKANTLPGADTIMIPAGTFTLTIAGANENAAATGDLDILDGVSIVGAGPTNTIIQAGTNNGNGIDKVFSVNPNFDTAFDTSFSGLTIRFGLNPSPRAGDGFGGGFDWEASGTGNLNITNCAITANSTTDGVGGGIAAFNTPGGSGGLTISNTTIDGNSSQFIAGGGLGGGLYIGPTGLNAVITNTQVLSNKALGTGGEGGGVFISGPAGTTLGIHQGAISSNTAAEDGAGIFTTAGVIIDQGTVFDQNSAGRDGGALFSNLSTSPQFPAGETTTLSKVTITANSAGADSTVVGHGGGIEVGSSATGNNLHINFSRIANNTVPGTGIGSALNNAGGTVSATNDWWGTNAPNTVIAGGVTFDPFIVLTNTGSPSTIRINQTSNVTASFLADNHGAAIPIANLTVLIGLPLLFDTPVLGSLTGAQTSIQASGTSTATFTAGGVGGMGHEDATVDNFKVTANIVVLQPPSIIKTFNPVSAAVNATSTLSFTIASLNVIPIDVSFSDALPVGLVVAAIPNITNACGGTVTAAAGSNTVAYSNPTLAANTAGCIISVDVRGTSDGVKSNTVTINSTAAGSNGASTSTTSLTVINPPTIGKSFGAATIPVNGTTSLSITLTSTNVNLTLNGVAFTDSLQSGLIVATPPNLVSTCSGIATAAATSSTVRLTGASLAPGVSCQVTVDVTGTIAGLKNNSVSATSTNAGISNTSNASIAVVAPPTISKAFAPTTVALNTDSTLSFTITNPNTTSTLSGVAFTDNLPTGVIVAATPNLTGSCGSGTITATAGSSTISLAGGTLTASPAAGSSCTFAVSVTSTSAGAKNNTTGAVTSVEGGIGATSNTAVLTVLAPPAIAKVFSPTSIPLNTTTLLTFTATNPAANTLALTGVAVSDTLPTGLTVANASATVCGGTLTTTAPTGIVLTGATIAVGSQCVFSVTVTGVTFGSYTNTTGPVTSTNGGTGNTASAGLTVVAAPSLSKSFNPISVALNASSALTFTVTNSNTASTLSGVAFTDSLPAGLVVAAAPNITGSCGSGTITAAAGSSGISLSGGTLTASPAAGSSCTFSVSVTGTTTGVKNNSVQVTSIEGGTGNTSSASLTVLGPPTISKSFGPMTVALNANSTLSFTVTNPNTASTMSGVAFTDTLPAGVIVAATPNLTGSCGSGAITAIAASGTISLSGGTLTASPAAGSSCAFSVSVTGASAGTKNNTTGTVTSTEGGTGATSNTAVLTVVSPPAIAKVFNPTAIALNATASLTFTITNPPANTAALAAVGFTDTLPTGLTVANASVTVCGGTLTTTAPTGIILTGATIAVGSQCVFSVTVTGAASGNYTNTTGSVTSTNGGTGNTASANLTVAVAPTIGKSFNPVSIALNAASTLSFTITNPNTNVALTGVAFTDSLPGGTVVAAAPNVIGTCGAGTITATPSSGVISLSGGTLTISPAAGSSCTFSVDVTGTTIGAKTNSVQVTSTEAGTGNTSNANLTIVGPSTISKSFTPTTVALNANSILSFTLTNPNTASSTSGLSFTDNLPSGVVVATPPNLTGSCGTGTITAAAGSGIVSLSGGTLTASPAAGSSCTFSVSVMGASAGSKNNTTSAVTSTEGGTGATSNTAVLTVLAPPAIAKVFNPTAIALNATTSLAFTITNPPANTAALTVVGFSDTLPTGLTVANASATVCGGTLTTTAPTGIVLIGATIAVGSQCVFSVTVTGAASGNYTNITGAVASANGGTGNTATATLNVATPPAITKSFGAVTIPLNGLTTLTFNITNPNTSVVLTGMAFTDNLPAGLVIAAAPNLSNTCGGSATAIAASGQVGLSNATLPSNGVCAVSVDIQGTTTGSKNNSVTVTSIEGGTGNTSNATLTVLAAAAISKAFNPTSIALNSDSALSFTITNPNLASSLSGITFTDNLPAGLVISTTPGSGACGGTLTATPGSGTLSLSGGTLTSSPGPGSSCTFSVNVTGTTPGAKSNTTGVMTSTEGGTGTTSNTATLTVVAPPSIAKVFTPNTISLNATSSLTFTITNPAANTAALSAVAFSDALPAGLTVANSSSTVCGGTLTTTAPTGITLTGATIAINSQCVFSVPVTGAASGAYTNTTGTVSSANGGTGNTASANLTVASPASIGKSFNPISIALNAGSALSFTITNSNSNVALTGVAFTDSLPGGLVVSTPNGLIGACGAGIITATPGSSSVSLSAGTLATTTSCTFSVNVTGTTAGLKNNSVTITSNEGGVGNTATATLTVISPAVIAKAFGAATLPLNGATSLTFNLSNSNLASALSGVAFTDSLPGGLILSTPNGLTGSCGGGTITATAGSGSIGLSGATLALSGTCTFSVNVTAIGAGIQNNTTSAVASNEGGAGNTANASITVLAPDLTVAKSHTGNFTQGQTGASYSLIVSNIGAAPTNGAVTIVDTLPLGLTSTAIGGVGWTCPTLNTCNRSDVLAPAGSYPAITLTVNVAANAAATVTNTGTVSGGGEGNTANDTATDPTTVVQVADLTVSKTHSGSFTPGQIGATYTLTVANVGPGPTTGVVTVIDTLPVAGITATAIGGAGWACTLATLTCTRSDVLASAASYPAITLTVNVSTTAPSSVTNTVTVSGGGELITGNDSASDTASILQLADLTLTKSHVGAFILGQTGSYTLTVNNVGPGPTLGSVTVADLLPIGLTAAAVSGSGWTCTLATLLCSRSDALNPGGSYPPITLLVNVSVAAPPALTNTATVSGGGELNLSNDSAADLTSLIAPIAFTASYDTYFVEQGNAGIFYFNITPGQSAALGGNITFSCNNLPANASCNFTPSTVTQTPVQVVLLIPTSKGTSAINKTYLPFERPMTVYAMLMLPLLGIMRMGVGRRSRRRRFKLLTLLLLVLVMMTMAACGGGGMKTPLSSTLTPLGSYPITVVAHGASGQTQTIVTLVVVKNVVQ